LTLPLVSYGGSSLVVSMIALGLLNNVGRCRPFDVAREAHKRPFMAWAMHTAGGR
jgi:cell division protein FtsW (lipid II flippase)